MTSLQPQCPQWYPSERWEALSDDEKSWVLANKQEALDMIGDEGDGEETETDAPQVSESEKAMAQAEADSFQALGIELAAKVSTADVIKVFDNAVETKEAANHAVLDCFEALDKHKPWAVLPKDGSTTGNLRDVYEIVSWTKKAKRKTKKGSVLNDVFDRGIGAHIVAKINAFDDAFNNRESDVQDVIEAKKEADYVIGGELNRWRRRRTMGRRYFRDAVRLGHQVTMFKELLDNVGMRFLHTREGKIVRGPEPIVIYNKTVSVVKNDKTGQEERHTSEDGHKCVSVTTFLSFDIEAAYADGGTLEAVQKHTHAPKGKNDNKTSNTSDGSELFVKTTGQFEAAMNSLASSIQDKEFVLSVMTETNKDDSDELLTSMQSVRRFLGRVLSQPDVAKRLAELDKQNSQAVTKAA